MTTLFELLYRFFMTTVYEESQQLLGPGWGPFGVAMVILFITLPALLAIKLYQNRRQ
uniref:Uncharacterized protein n=1 Tax=Magnetococcus massalia (strain MO-1) TaxID=451514 RepID=A0A1S7LIK6_MAGMO|nr:protein of unknown function [Candidatus Magnetococcus massalia]